MFHPMYCALAPMCSQPKFKRDGLMIHAEFKEATDVRARQLGIQHCLVGVKDKVHAPNTLQMDLAISPAETVFVGDDLNDLAVRPVVALLLAPADACASVRRGADFVLSRRGGHGAVRELAERILQARGGWSLLNNRGWRDRND